MSGYNAPFWAYVNPDSATLEWSSTFIRIRNLAHTLLMNCTNGYKRYTFYQQKKDTVFGNVEDGRYLEVSMGMPHV